MKRSCVDCGSTTRKLYGQRSPRCRACSKADRERRSKAAHERRVQKTYGLLPGEYDALYEYQGGRCALCRRATGKSKRLAVDHCHRTEAVRGLLCATCNKTLGHMRDDPVMAQRFVDYLRVSPYSEFKKGLR